MFGWFRKKFELPSPLTGDVIKVGIGCEENIKSQIALFEKDHGRLYDISDGAITPMTVMYCFGFVLGALHATGSIKSWETLSGTDNLRHTMVMLHLLKSLCSEEGAKNHLNAAWKFRGTRRDLQAIEAVGAEDGIAMANFRKSKYEGGGLYLFLANYIKEAAAPGSGAAA